MTDLLWLTAEPSYSTNSEQNNETDYDFHVLTFLYTALM